MGSGDAGAEARAADTGLGAAESGDSAAAESGDSVAAESGRNGAADVALRAGEALRKSGM